MRRRKGRATRPKAAGTSVSGAAEGTPRPPPAVWTALPYVIFAALYALTFKTWLLPFQDSGREIGVATRLALGETLYRDVAYWFGPLPPLADAAVLRLSGFRLDALLAVRLVFALLGVEVLRRLARRLFDSPTCAAWGVSAVVALCLFERNGGSWAFPYCAPSLEGFVLGLWALEAALGSRGWRGSLAAAALAALAAGTKLEYAPLSLLALAVALGARRPRREALLATAAAAAGGALFWLVPLARQGSDLLRTQGFLLALDVPAPWKRLYQGIAWGYFSLKGNLLTQILQSYLPGVLVVLAALVLVRLFGGASRVVAILVLALGGVAGWLPANLGIHAFIPASAVLVAAQGTQLIRKRRGEALEERTIALFALGAAMLPLFVRQPFFLLRLTPYSAFSGPIPLLISFSFVSRLLDARRSSAMLLAGLAFGAALSAERDWAADDRVWVRFPRGSLRLPAAEGRLIEALVDRLRRDTSEGGFVAGFPEPGVVLFFADRRNPFPWEQFNPGDQGAVAERVMIRDLEKRRPEAAFVVNRPMMEFGESYFGGGYLEEFRKALLHEMSLAEVFRPPPGLRTPSVRGDGALYFRPRELQPR
ncbi:MAG: hypothetical protein ACM3JH_12685 [Acidithiobacillales bacterium]